MPRPEMDKQARPPCSRLRLRVLKTRSWRRVLSAQVSMRPFANSREKPKRPNGSGIASTKLPASVALAATTTGMMGIAELDVWKRKMAEQPERRIRAGASSWKGRVELSCCIAWKPSEALKFAYHPEIPASDG